GFSTTAPLLASTNGLIQAATVTKDTVFLYDLTNPAAPVLVDPTTYINEPCEFTSACNDPTALSPVIAIQPAGATAGDATSVFRTRPLKDNTNYAFVISDKVLDKTGKGLGKASIGGILLFNNPLVVNGTSQLQGVDSATATALEIMRQALIPVKAKVLADKGISSDHIAMAYTFKTQTITSTAVQLAALPYTTPATTALTGAITTSTPAQAFAKFGVDPDLVPSSHISEIIETTITTFDLLDPATGAFRADATPAAITIPVLIAVPKLTAAPPLVAPVMVFRHGLGGGRADMLTVADTFNSKGMLVIAIDAAKHGDRTLCAKGDKTTCAGAAVCTSQLPAGAQGDANPPGVCPAVANSNGFNNGPVSPSCATNANCNWTGAYGVPLASSNFLISANFFRSRDTLRQDIIDQSQLIRAIAVAAPDPLHPAPFGHTVFDHLLGQGIVINAAQVFFSGQSLGAIQGTVDVASNPRISKAVLNVGGGTVVDIFTNSPAFKSGVLTLLQSLGISPGTSAYLQFLAVAKLILDPADPVNFAGHITGNNLPNLLPPLGGNTNGSVPQSPKKLLQQVAFCDQVVPNPFSFVWSSTAGTSPQLVAPTFGGPGNFQLFYTGTSAPTAQNLASCPAPGGLPIPSGAVQHAFITNWTDSFQTGKAQTDAANFVVSDTLPNSLVVLP
ncbi:MAG: hypothetical protein JST92_04265, partial [Deltaproteobacteria bacterium]|nr:hypothetical protein [Deltaproteobacteria bacterium]